ncbi:MAG: Gfo/Idh/MocA family oxidoreductase, partial [Oscillospiraceae bacterium]
MANYAIIGCGYTGSIHAENLCSLPNTKVTACYDIDLLRANAMHISTGATVYDSVEALCSASDVDAVLITTPNNAHLMPALIAAQHKKHIFCEKPIALSEADTQNMIT